MRCGKCGKAIWSDEGFEDGLCVECLIYRKQETQAYLKEAEPEGINPIAMAVELLKESTCFDLGVGDRKYFKAAEKKMEVIKILHQFNFFKEEVAIEEIISDLQNHLKELKNGNI